LENGSNDFDYISGVYGDHLPKWVHMQYIHVYIGNALKAQKLNVKFVETDFTGLTDSTVLRYTASNNALACNSGFRFQGNVVTDNCS
jgi:hypothetical protein